MEPTLTLQQVSDILQVEQSTIRFWEKEFAEFLHIKVKKGQHKRFTQKHMETLSMIKELLYIELYTIKGAKRRLEMDLTLTNVLGIEGNFKTTVLLMFSSIMKELHDYKDESRQLAEQVRELRMQKTVVEEQLTEERNKGLIDFLKDKIQTKKA
ncbi:MAG TPA: MerR family transcriptional regulator [Desulfobacteria bacterium]|nr:MerR family transcriptional regulator [Desulfobacteria bacterium]